MSTDLVQITPTAPPALSTLGGSSMFGGNSKFFTLKPSNMELQQKTSRAEGSQEGKFRVSETGQHYESLHAVLMFDPETKRAMYANKNEFGVPPLCYSVNGEVPADGAQAPQALNCARCRHSDWTKWKKTKNSDDLPKCGEHFRLFIVTREARIPYKLSVRGKSISKMRGAMSTIATLAELYFSENGHYPNLFDFSFKINVERKTDSKGVYYVMNFSEIGLINEDDRHLFGSLYEKFVAARASGELKDDAERGEEEFEQGMSESGSSQAQAQTPRQQPQTTSDNEVTI